MVHKPVFKLLILLLMAGLYIVAQSLIPNDHEILKAVLVIPTFGYVTLSESVNKIIVPNTFLQSKYFPSKRFNPTKVIQADIVVGNQKLAPFVKRGAPGKVLSNLGKKTSLVEPPTIRMKKGLNAEDLLFTRGEGAPIHVIGSGGANPIADYRMQKIAMEQQDMKNRYTRALEFLCAQVFTGKLTYVSDDVEFEVDYLLPSDNKPVLTSGDLWSAASTAKPIDNIRAWKKIVKKATGKIPTEAIMTSEVWSAFIGTTQVGNYFNKLKINIGEIKTDQNILSMGAELVAHIENINFYVYDEYYTNASGVQTPFIAEDKFVLTAPTLEKTTEYGAIEDLEAGSVIGEMFSKDWTEKDPSLYWVLTESHPLPVDRYPETNIYAKVL